MGHANKRARPQHHWRFGHSPRMPGHCTQRVGQHSVSGLTSRDSITYHANKPLERTGRTPSLRTDSLGSLEMVRDSCRLKSNWEVSEGQFNGRSR